MQPKPYKIVKHVQGSPEWLSWRRSGIGASDSPIILGKSPYKTAYELYLEMAGISVPVVQSETMRFGHEMEPEIRAWAEKELSVELMPICIASNNSCFKASIDGMSFDEDVFVEIKCNNKDSHLLAKSGQLVDHHMIQMQHQFGVLGHEANRKGYYVSYNNGDFRIVEVKPCVGVWDEIVEKGNEFWQMVQHKTPPKVTEADHVYRDDEDLYQRIEQLNQLNEQLKSLEKKYQEEKEKIIFDCGNRPTRIRDFFVTKGFRKGAIDYSQIPQLQGVDLEIFRKAPTVTWAIK